MDTDSRARSDELVTEFTAVVNSTVVTNGRAGIVKLVDEYGKPRVLYRHQIHAVERLIDNTRLCEGGTDWYNRKSSLLAIHDLGTGKTITGILALAAIHSAIPDLDAEISVIVCPLSVLSTWMKALHSWTTYESGILVADKHSLITDEALSSAKVIVTTPGVLVSAYKSYMVADKKSTAKLINDRFVRGSKKEGAELPPVHPLYKRMLFTGGFTCAIIDELHKVCSPTTIQGHVIGMLCRATTYTLGLTGTPVTARPQQVAHLAKALNSQPAWMQESRHFSIRAQGGGVKRKRASSGGDQSIRRDTLKLFHEKLVDRVDSSFIELPQKAHTVVEFDPFIGRDANGVCNPKVIAKHNEMLEEAQKRMREDERAANDPATSASTYEKFENKTWNCIVSLGQYEFDATLGYFGAKKFKDDPTLYERSLANPSEYVKLISRMLTSRQKDGHARITVFCESTVQLRIMRNYLEREASHGSLFLYDGTLAAFDRGKVVHDFLQSERGVLLLSAAGAIGTTICPGCEVLFCVGSVPWNSSTLEQAHGRVYRIGQDKAVEIVQFMPRRSVTVAKLALHVDKRDRLAKAVKDEDYSEFSVNESDKEKWRHQVKILSDVRPLNGQGNYALTKDEFLSVSAWRKICEMMDANGMKRTPAPCEVPIVPKLAADLQLPRSPFILAH